MVRIVDKVGSQTNTVIVMIAFGTKQTDRNQIKNNKIKQSESTKSRGYRVGGGCKTV